MLEHLQILFEDQRRTCGTLLAQGCWKLVMRQGRSIVTVSVRALKMATEQHFADASPRRNPGVLLLKTAAGTAAQHDAIRERQLLSVVAAS